MAKGQQGSGDKGQRRGNKEVRKPKATKPPAPVVSPFAPKSGSAAATPPKRKG